MSSDRDEAPFAFSGLDRLFHERARLGIVTSLAGHPDGLVFAELKRMCGLTDGNLNRHLNALEEAGYVATAKDFDRKRPLTTCQLTKEGRDRFLSYLSALESALREGTRAAAAGPDRLKRQKA